MEHAISTRWLANLNRSCIQFPHDFGARMNKFIIIKEKFFSHSLYGHPLTLTSPHTHQKKQNKKTPCCLLNLQWLSSCFEHVSSWYPFLRPHHTTPHRTAYHSKYRCPFKISNQIKHGKCFFWLTIVSYKACHCPGQSRAGRAGQLGRSGQRRRRGQRGSCLWVCLQKDGNPCS